MNNLNVLLYSRIAIVDRNLSSISKGLTKTIPDAPKEIANV